MITFLVALGLVSVALLGVVLRKTYFYLPARELKRQAARGDSLAKMLFRAAAYGRELRLLLWGVVGLGSATGIVLFARVAPTILGIVAVGLIVWLAFLWLPQTRLTAIGAQLAVWCTPSVVWLLRLFHSVLEALSGYVERYTVSPHTGIYEREDLNALLNLQKQQSDNRISEQEIERIRQTLHFNDHKVRDVIVPARHVKAVNVDENIGPVLLDELHSSSHERFPVYEGKTTNIVGTLAIDTVADIKKEGKVRNYYDHHLAYLNENDSLEQALRAFYETKQHLFIVINGSDEYVGIVTLTSILKQLTGSMEDQAFGRHDDRPAVASRHSPSFISDEQPEEKPSENTPEVVE